MLSHRRERIEDEVRGHDESLAPRSDEGARTYYYQDLDRCTFDNFLNTLLDKDNFNFYKEIDGCPMISPCWSVCLSCELELRKDAIRLCKEQSFGIQAALWTAPRLGAPHEALAPAGRDP